MKNQQLNLLRLSCTLGVTYLLLLSSFCLRLLTFWLCLSVDIYVFIVLWVYWASWISRWHLGNFQSLRFQIFFLSFHLSFLSGTPLMSILVCLMLSRRSLRLCSFSSFFFLYAPQLEQFQLCFFKFTFSCFLAQICCWAPLMKFLFQLFYFSAL